MKANVYIDGFNLYYGRVKGTPYKWLDLAAMCRLLLPRDTINRIRYFTALIQPRPGDPQAPQRQQTYLRALATIPNLSIHYGHFLTQPVWLPFANPPARSPRTVEVLRTEEKGSDVNLATLLLTDAFDGDYEVAVVISSDSDLKLVIEIVRNKLGLPVGVLNPQKVTSWALQKTATFYRSIREGPLKASQFPITLTDAQGTITKPAGW